MDSSRRLNLPDVTLKVRNQTQLNDGATGRVLTGTESPVDDGKYLLDVAAQRVHTILFASISVSSSGATSIVSAQTGEKIKVLSYTLVCDGAVTVKFQSGSTDLTGAMSFAANGGISSSVGTPSGGWLFETAAGQALNINLGSSTGVRGHLSYFLEA